MLLYKVEGGGGSNVVAHWEPRDSYEYYIEEDDE